jgi:hypothetical protein
MRRPGKKTPRLRKFGQLIVLIGSIAVLCAHFTGYLEVLSTAKLSEDAHAKLLGLLGDPEGTTYLAVIAEVAAELLKLPTISGIIVFCWCVVHSVSVSHRIRSYFNRRAARRIEPKARKSAAASVPPSRSPGRPVSGKRPAVTPLVAAAREENELSFADGAGI